ncbi:hypothetical protein [Dickeya zeae]|uniref:hypothetical protein n=1 Tax=Dickeya zeae TaxID=204042 RepID=UPI000372E18F|nr:hypothetical protein [Dickeya zeae]UJR52581.1 hypothetical protein J417_03645 [Dickeya zeae MS1]
MYYHAVIEKKPAKMRKLVLRKKTGLTKEQLIARFIEPYEHGIVSIPFNRTIHFKRSSGRLIMSLRRDRNMQDTIN